jgi:hypothetical protein
VVCAAERALSSGWRWPKLEASLSYPTRRKLMSETH